jgi:hypothetical protein
MRGCLFSNPLTSYVMPGAFKGNREEVDGEYKIPDKVVRWLHLWKNELVWRCGQRNAMVERMGSLFIGTWW